MEDNQKRLIQRALKKAKGNKSVAAKLLGLHRPRLYALMERLGIKEAE